MLVPLKGDKGRSWNTHGKFAQTRAMQLSDTALGACAF